MKYLLSLFLLSVSAFANTSYTCTNSASADAAGWTAGLVAGTFTVTGPTCNLTGGGTFSIPDNTSVQASGSVTVNGNGTSHYQLHLNGNTVTVNGFVFNAISILDTFQNSSYTSTSTRHDFIFTNNIIQNITNGDDGIHADSSYWYNWLIDSNQFINITSIPMSSWTTSLIEENNGSFPCTSWTNGCNGRDIANNGHFTGAGNLSITNNKFDTVFSDAISVQFGGSLGSTSQNSTFNASMSSNNNYSYNEFTHVHRMANEDGGGSCDAPGCAFGLLVNLKNWKLAGNYMHDFVAPYFNSFGFSFNGGTFQPQFINNTVTLGNSPGGPGYGFELGNKNQIFQGNVCTYNSGQNPFDTCDEEAYPGTGYTSLQQNNFIATTLNAFGYGDGQPNYGGTWITQYNSIVTNCDTPSNCAASNLTAAFISANNQMFPTGGNGTWTFYTHGQLSTKWVNFYIDSSSTPIVLQELSDQNTNFASDRKWLYHATFDTTSLSGGSHTLKAIATDVSGATVTVTQNFTTGSGPGASFSPVSLPFGVITLGNSSSPQVTTLTNTGTTTLTISGGITITGTNSGDFTKTTTCGSTLAASATCTVTVTFTPIALGPRVAFVTITDNASGSPHQVALSGGASPCVGSIVSNCNFATGQSPWGFAGGSLATMVVDATGPSGVNAAHITATSSVPPGSNIEVFQDSLTFPANGTIMQLQFDGMSSRSQAINVLGILSVSPFTSYGLAWMPTITNTYQTLKSPYFKVVGSPTSGSGRLTFQADGATAGDQVFATNASLVNVGSVPISTLSATAANFAPQAVGTTGTGSVITITNNGIANLVISGIVLSGGQAGDFGQTNTCVGTPVVPTGTCTITPTFTPTNPGARASNIVITSNDASQSPQSIPTTGNATGTGEVTAITFPFTGHGSFSLAFTTQSNSTNDRVRYGTTPCITGTGGTVQTNFLAFIKSTYARLAVGGLSPSTQYYVCPEVSKDSGSTWTTGAQSSLITATLPAVHPAMPLPPLDMNSDYPSQSGYTDQHVTSDAGFSTAYGTACTNWASGGQRILVAPGTVLGGGPYAFTCVPPDVFSFLPSAVTLPSTIHWANHGFNENDLVLFGRTYAGGNPNAVPPTPDLVIYPTSVSCDIGWGSLNMGGIQSGQRYQVHVVDASNIQVRCLPQTQVDPGVPQAAPPIMVFTDVGSAVTGQHFVAVPFKTTHNDANGNPVWERRLLTSPYSITPDMIIQADTSALPPEHTQITPAWSSSMFKFVDPIGNITNSNTAHPFMVFGDVDPNVEIPIGNIRIVGAEITTADYATSTHSSDPWFWNYVYVTYPWDSQVICDRCYYHMLGAPNREFIGMPWNGSNMAWIDSYSDNLTYFHAGLSLTVAKVDATHFTIAAGTQYAGFGPIVLPSTETVTLSGSGSGRVRAYFDLTSSNALTVSVPSGITASCSPATCATTAPPSGSPSGICNATFDTTNTENASDLWPKTSNGEPTVGQIGCADVTSGSITTAGSANPGQSLWNGEGDDHMLGGIGPGPYKVVHSFSDGAGIQWFWNDAGNFGYRGNYIFNRNYVKQDLKYMHGSSTSDGEFYFDRQPMEWKGGQNLLLKGNIFDGAWREDIPDTGFFAIQPLTGGQVTDVNFLSNTLIHGSAVLQGPTNTCGGGGGDPCSGPSIRIHIANMLTEDINGYVYDAHNPNGNNGVGSGNAGLGWENQIQGLEDLSLDHNTFTTNRGATPWIMSMTQQALEGYSDTNSFHWYSGVPSQTNTNYQDGSGGTDTPPNCGGLSNVGFMNCGFTPSYNFSQNVLLGGYGDTSVPSGQSTAATMISAFSGLTNNSFVATGTVPGTASSVKWWNPMVDSSNGSYCLAVSSPYNAGNSGLNSSADVGINCDQLDIDQGKLKMIGTPNGLITTAGFTVAYVAADSAACNVGHSTTNDITTATWQVDAGGARARSTAVTGLSTGTLYFGWTLCPGNSIMSQASFQVKTK